MKNYNMPPDEPQTLKEFLWYCMEYKNEIFFRASRFDPKSGVENMCNVSLANLTPEEFGDKIGKMIKEGRLPVRVRRPGETEQCSQTEL